MLNAGGALMDPGLAPAINTHLDAVADAVGPWATGGSYLNFAERRAERDTLFPADTVRRLEDVKARWDPTGMFHANFTLTAA